MARADIWTAAHVKSLAPDEASIPAAREVLRKGGFGAVEPTGDGRGWWVVCRGITDTYQVSVRRTAGDAGEFDCECTCPSYKYPCKHALALLLYLVEHPELRTEAAAPKAAASDFEGLLRAVFANPEEDTPRLVFADFLEENDQPDRAALVRHQCEQARLKPNSTRSRELKKLVKPLVAKFRKQIEPLPEGMGYEFRRGFLRLESASLDLLDPGALPARVVNLFREGWVETLTTSLYGVGEALGAVGWVGELDVSRHSVSEDALVALVAETAEARATGRLARVKVHKVDKKSFDRLVAAERGEAAAPAGNLGPDRRHFGLTPRVFDLLLRTGRFDGAENLVLHGALGDAELAALLAADLHALRRLYLGDWTLTRTGVEALATGPALARLEELVLERCAIGTGGAAALAAAAGLRRLETLRLPDCGLTDAGAEALAEARGFPNLKHLDLRTNAGITARGAAAVLATKHVPHLSEIYLQEVAVPEPGQVPLVLDALDPSRPAGVVTFDEVTVRYKASKGETSVSVEADGNDAGGLFDDFAACAGAKRVTHFVACRVAAPAGALAAGFDPGKLTSLELDECPLRNDGAAALAAAFAHFELKELTLRGCRVQAAGVAALAGGPLFAGLRALDLSHNNIGKAGVAALVRADVPRALKYLTLEGCRLGDAEKRQLRTKFGPRVRF